jgi:hypothetical protein
MPDLSSSSSRREFLLGLAARYPELRGACNLDALPPALRARLEPDLADTDLAIIAGFALHEIADAERRIFERFAEVQQYGV